MTEHRTLPRQVTLGVNLLGNDTSAALVDGDGSIIAVAEEERYSSVKGGRPWAPPAWVLEVLDEHGVEREAVTALGAARIQALHALRAPIPHRGPGPDYWQEAKATSLAWLVRHLPACQTVLEVRHHLCHAASAFYASPFASSAVVTADGMGELETATIWRADERGLQPCWSRELPHSMGLAYEAVADWVGLTGVEKEGKLMGLAALGEPRYRAKIREHLLAPDRELVFVVRDEFARLPARSHIWAAHLEELFGPPGPGGDDVRDIDADLAASIQAVLEECLRELLEKARRLTGETACAAAGGVFMNSVANGMLDRRGIFDALWVQPLAGDAGTSLGAALVARDAAQPRPAMVHAFLGSALGDVRECARRRGLHPVPADNLVETVVDLLLDGRVIGWASGRAEVGPRALGHRSILADPRHAHIRDVVNARIKQRERWRPFAPIVLEEDVPKLFDRTVAVPFMNMVAQTSAPEHLTAAVHVDGSARVQTVPPDEPELARMRALLTAVKQRTGFGVLLNTSLNGRGQPIARTADDVIDTYFACGLDALVMDDLLFMAREDCVIPSDHAASHVGARPWIVVAPWWQPDDQLLARALGGAPWHSVGPADWNELAGAVSAAAEGDTAGIVVAVPVWSEVANETLGALFSTLLPRPTPPVLLVDEDGRHCVFDGHPTGDGPLGPVGGWWATRAMATRHVPS